MDVGRDGIILSLISGMAYLASILLLVGGMKLSLFLYRVGKKILVYGFIISPLTDSRSFLLLPEIPVLLVLLIMLKELYPFVMKIEERNMHHLELYS